MEGKVIAMTQYRSGVLFLTDIGHVYEGIDRGDGWSYRLIHS